MRNINPLSKCRRDFLDVLAATTSLLLINGLPCVGGPAARRIVFGADR